MIVFILLTLFVCQLSSRGTIQIRTSSCTSETSSLGWPFSAIEKQTYNRNGVRRTTFNFRYGFMFFNAVVCFGITRFCLVGAIAVRSALPRFTLRQLLYSCSATFLFIALYHERHSTFSYIYEALGDGHGMLFGVGDLPDILRFFVWSFCYFCSFSLFAKNRLDL